MLQHYLIQVEPRRIKFNPLNPRKHRGTEYVRLKESIEQIGIIQPPIVRVLPGNMFEVVDGEGRVSVAKELGLEKVEVISVGIVDDQEALMLLQTSNALRSYNFLAECKGLANLYHQGISSSELAKKFGCNGAKISTMVAIGSFPSQILAQIEEDISKSEQQAGVWSPTLLTNILPLREVLSGEKPMGHASSEDHYDYNEVRKAVELVISGKIIDSEKMHIYVVNRRYEIYQNRFDQELQRKLEEKLAVAKQELDAAKMQEILSMELKGEQRVRFVQEEYQGQVAILQTQLANLKKQHAQNVREVARSSDVVEVREQAFAKELEKTQEELEKTQEERKKYEILRKHLQEEADQARLKSLQEERLRQKQLEEEARRQLALKDAALREDQERKLAQLEDNLKGVYEQKQQELQFEAENTIQGLLSHGIQQVTEAQQAIDHIVSPSMIDGVRQLGGAQYESLLWAVRSMREALDRAEQKLTYSDAICVEGETVNGHKQSSGGPLS